MKFGFGIIGCGMIAQFHAKAIADLENATLAACYDMAGERAKQFGEEQGCQAYDDLDAMLADENVHVVTICSPSGAHLEPAVAAAKAGKHVIVEKPLEITLERCDAIIDACREAGVKLAVIFPSRFHESSQLMKQAIDSGRFGRLTMGDSYVKWFRTQEYYDSGQWRGTWKLDGGGALMNQAIHSVDLLTWLMGPVSEISAHTDTLAHERIEVEDTAVATLRFENGALGVIEATTAAFPGWLKKIELHGSKGSAALEEESIVQWSFADETDEDEALRQRMKDNTETGGGAADPTAIGHHGHTMLFHDALDAIAEDREPAVNGAEGRRSVEIILAIYQAAEEGKAVSLPLPQDPKLKARGEA